MRGQTARRVRDLEGCIGQQAQELATAKAQIAGLESDLHQARLGEWAAKRGLADYMQEHGLGHRINPTILSQIEAGPPVENAL